MFGFAIEATPVPNIPALLIYFSRLTSPEHRTRSAVCYWKCVYCVLD
jgi:hypothetical protein